MLKFAVLSFHCYLAAGGKSVGTFSVILKKPATTPYTLPPPPKKKKMLNFEQNRRKWVLLLGTTLLGGVRRWKDEPRAHQKLSLGAYETVIWKGFFHSVWGSFDLYFHYWTAHHFNSLDKTSLVGCLCFHKHTELHNVLIICDPPQIIIFFRRGASKKSPNWLYNIKAIGVKQLTETNN